MTVKKAKRGAITSRSAHAPYQAPALRFTCHSSLCLNTDCRHCHLVTENQRAQKTAINWNERNLSWWKIWMIDRVFITVRTRVCSFLPMRICRPKYFNHATVCMWLCLKEIENDVTRKKWGEHFHNAAWGEVSLLLCGRRRAFIEIGFI